MAEENKTEENKTTTTQTAAIDHSKEIAELKASNAALMARLDKLATTENKTNDDGLLEQARKQKQDAEKKVGDHKALESALKFQMKSPEWLKANESLLPKDVKEIFSAAEKEKYESAVDKDAAIKSGIVQSFFQVQANLDLLTPGLKNSLDEFLSLTKNGKQEKAQQAYDNIFEPAFEMLRRVKKAEAINKGHGDPDDDQAFYKNKMISLSKKHYLGEKQ